MGKGPSSLAGQGFCMWKFSGVVGGGTWCASRRLGASGAGERTQRPPVPVEERVHVVPGCELVGWRVGEAVTEKEGGCTPPPPLHTQVWMWVDTLQLW